MAVLHTQPLDELGGGPARLRELLSHPLAERRCKRIHLPNRGLAGLLHLDYQSSRRRCACAELVQESRVVASAPKISLKAKEDISMDKTSLVIDRVKVAEAREILGTKTLAETVDAALEEVLRLDKRRRVMDRIREQGGLGPDPAELRQLRTR